MTLNLEPQIRVLFYIVKLLFGAKIFPKVHILENLYDFFTQPNIIDFQNFSFFRELFQFLFDQYHVHTLLHILQPLNKVI